MLIKPAVLAVSPKSEPTLELHSRDVPSVEAYHHVNGPNTEIKFWKKVDNMKLCSSISTLELMPM